MANKDNTSYELSPEEEDKILQLYEKEADLGFIVESIWKGKDGRSKEGRATRKFLSRKGLNYGTTKYVSAREGSVVFDENQQKIIVELNNQKMNVLEIAKHMFPEKAAAGEIKSPLCYECQQISKVIKRSKKGRLLEGEDSIGIDYEPPTTQEAIILLVNRYCGEENLNQHRLTAQQKRDIDALKGHMRVALFVREMSMINNKNDRELVESEFVRNLWGKQDITPEELSLYVRLAVDHLELIKLKTQKEKLDYMFDRVDDEDGKVAVSLSEAIKTKSEEQNRIVARIEKIINKLNGDRAKRVEARSKIKTSFLDVVEFFMEEEERKKMLIISKAKLKEIEDEANRLEDLDSVVARIVGISKEQVF